MFCKKEQLHKAIPVGKLIEILGNLPSDALINTNRVGNLAVITRDELHQLGTIEIGFEVYEENEPEWQKMVIADKRL